MLLPNDVFCIGDDKYSLKLTETDELLFSLGEGYKFLLTGEKVGSEDEYLNTDGTWVPVADTYRIYYFMLPHRRKI